MSAAYRCDAWGMARSLKPVVDGRPNCATPKRRFAGALMACDEEDDALAVPDRLLKSMIDREPSAIEAHAMKVDDTVGGDAPGRKPLVPAAIESRARRSTLRRL
jgi:hypothetical protein